MGSLTTALPDASTTVKGKVQLDSTTSSTSTTTAGTPSAVKAAYDLANTANGAAAAAQSTANTAVTNAATAQTTANGKVSQDMGHGNVGSLVFAECPSPGATITPGTTKAGSSLYAAGLQYDSTPMTWGSYNNAVALSGTWRSLGYILYSGSSTKGATLFQRIA